MDSRERSGESKKNGWIKMRIPCASGGLPIYFAALRRGETNVSWRRCIFCEGDGDDEMGARDFDGGGFCSAARGLGWAKFFEPGDGCAEQRWQEAFWDGRGVARGAS